MTTPDPAGGRAEAMREVLEAEMADSLKKQRAAASGGMENLAMMESRVQTVIKKVLAAMARVPADPTPSASPLVDAIEKCWNQIGAAMEDLDLNCECGWVDDVYYVCPKCRMRNALDDLAAPGAISTPTPPPSLREAADHRDDDDEEWRPVPGYEGLYEVSNKGVIASFHSGERTPLKPTTARGYEQVALCRDGKSERTVVHHVVAAVFIGPRPEGPDGRDINHINGIKDDNRACNLRYCSRSENVSHAMGLGLLEPRRGSSNGSAKLTEDQVIEIRQRYEDGGISQESLGAEFGVSRSVVSEIVRGKSWRHLFPEFDQSMQPGHRASETAEPGSEPFGDAGFDDMLDQDAKHCIAQKAGYGGQDMAGAAIRRLWLIERYARIKRADLASANPPAAGPSGRGAKMAKRDDQKITFLDCIGAAIQSDFCDHVLRLKGIPRPTNRSPIEILVDRASGLSDQAARSILVSIKDLIWDRLPLEHRDFNDLESMLILEWISSLERPEKLCADGWAVREGGNP